MAFVPPPHGPFYVQSPSPIPLYRTPSPRSEIYIPEPDEVISAPVVPSSPVPFYTPPPSPGPYYVPSPSRHTAHHHNVSSGGGTIRVWNLENGEQEGTSMEHTSSYMGNLPVTGDGTRIITCDENGRIRVWDVESHELVREWTYPGVFSELAISPDDQLVAVGSWMVFIYTIEGRQVNHSIAVGKMVQSLSFSPTGDKLACGACSDVYVYDAVNGTLLLGPLQGHEKNVHRMLWSRDGSRLFAASFDATIRCWNSDTGEQIGEPWTHTHGIQSITFSPDGSKLASASYTAVRFWDAISGSPITPHLEHAYIVNAVSFSPSGEFMASATSNGNIYVWRVPWLDPIENPVMRRLSDVSQYPHSSFSLLPQASNADIPNLRFILPDLSLGLDERQHIFEVRLRKLLNLATSKGFHVSRDVFPPSLPVSSANTSFTGMERIADGNSNAMDTSPIEPSMLVSGSNSNGVTKETRKVDKIKRNLFDMLRDIIFKRSGGKDT
ncbi:WD40 repeat-like protein [Imleria badia]|nr:WD40 repeat-like protein [Imleria badia]